MASTCMPGSTKISAAEISATSPTPDSSSAIDRSRWSIRAAAVTTSRRLREAISAVTALPVSHVVLTHFHPDHVFGASVFAGVDTVVAHVKYIRSRTQRAESYRRRFDYLLDGAGAGEEFLQPTDTVAVGTPLLIDLGERELQVQAWPVAHTDNDLTVLDERTNTLWASDLVFHERLPSLDGSLRGWLDVLSELEAIEPARVVPGHGSPGTWDEVATEQTRYLTDLLEETRAAIASGTSLSRAIDEIGQPETGDVARLWAMWDLHHPANVTAAYTELEWE